MVGVMRVFTATDIPGENNFSTTSLIWSQEAQIFLASTQSAANQPVAIVVAGKNQLAVSMND